MKNKIISVLCEHRSHFHGINDVGFVKSSISCLLLKNKITDVSVLSGFAIESSDGNTVTRKKAIWVEFGSFIFDIDNPSEPVNRFLPEYKSQSSTVYVEVAG